MNQHKIYTFPSWPPAESRGLWAPASQMNKPSDRGRRSGGAEVLNPGGDAASGQHQAGMKDIPPVHQGPDAGEDRGSSCDEGDP